MTGGPGKTILNTAKYINKDKFSIHVATFVPRGNPNTEFSKKLEESNIPCLKLIDTHGIFLRNLYSLRQYIKDMNIKVLHTHAYKADGHGLIMKMLTKHIVLITTHHGWISNTFSQRLFVSLDLLFSRFFDGISVVSADLVKRIPDSRTKKQACEVIHNGLMLADYKPKHQRNGIRRQFSIAEDDVVLGVVGRLSVEKGCIDILNAFKMVHKEISKTKLIFVGEGPLREVLQNNISVLNLKGKAILAGYHSSVNAFYEAFDIFVCPSKTEGLSNVILESFAYGLPVIATKVGGNPEIIDDRANGLLVTSGDLEEMKAAIVELIMDRQLRSTLGSNGYNTAIERFDFLDRVLKEELFYSRILARHDAKRS